MTKFGSHTTNTALFNAIKQFFQTKGKVGGAVLYLWIYNSVDSDYAALGQNASAGTFTDYMTGHVVNVDWELVSGVYYIRNLIFQECLV